MTVLTTNGDAKLAEIPKRAAATLDALKNVDPRTRSLVKACSDALREISAATKDFARVSSGGKAPSKAIQTRLQRAGAARGDAEGKLRATCR